jgi:hypothetical protein
MSERSPRNRMVADPDHFDVAKFDEDGRSLKAVGGRRRILPQQSRAEIYQLMVQIDTAKKRIQEICDECGVSKVTQSRGVKLTRIWREKGA